MVIKIEHDKMEQRPWWNRPLIGKKTLTEYLLGGTSRDKIPFEMIYYHNQILEKLEKISITLKALFNSQFVAKDFLVYARLEEYLTKENAGNKHYLSLGKNLFKLVLDNLNSLIRLKQLEEKFDNEILQAFYQDSQKLIGQENHKLVLQAKLKKCYQLYSQQLTTEEDIYLLKKYYRYLFNLSEIECLLEFVSLLKKHQLDNWEFFKMIRGFIYDNQEDSIDELKGFLLLTKIHKELLLKICETIIKIEKSSVDESTTIAQILQYIALNYKYENLYPQFRLFLSYLRKWEKMYYDLLAVREQYDSEEYLIPSSFKNKPHGFELYKSYHDYLDSRYLLKQL